VKPVSQFHHGARKANRLVGGQAHMAEHRGLSLGSAIERLIDAGALGIVLLDSKLRVVARHGTLVEWVPLDLAVGEALPFLVGYEDVLEAVGRGRDESFHLAKIRLSGVERGETSVYSIHAFASVETDGVLLLFQDATEVAMLEQRVLQQRNELALTQKALNRAKLDAESANRAKSAFLANVSHELRTPLNVIIGDAEILRDQTPAGMDSAELETYLSDIHDSGLFLLELINDLLDLSKAEAGRMELIEEAVDVGDLIAEAVAMAEALPYAKGLEFTQVVEPAHITLLADGRRLKQVLLNLLSNAAKFTPEGGRVTVEASVGDGHFTIWVSDTGSGIAAEDLERLTEPFVQLARSADGPAGTGLGLHLVKTFVELHGGQISMASEPGGGTTVTLRFPPERLAD
jgi:signal transduction histidine kinase